MSLMTKILMGFVVAAVFPLLYLSAGVLKVNKIWREMAQKFEKVVVAEEKKNFDQLHGDAKARLERYQPGRAMNGTPGVRQVEVALHNLKLGRGRFWYVTRVDNSTDPAAGKFKISILTDDVENAARQPLVQHNIKDKSFVYIFQLRHDGVRATNDRYVGEFVVDGLTLDANGVPTDSLVPLKPSMPYVQAQWDALNAGTNVQWVVYEHMPMDDHDVFSDLTESEIRERMPASVADEYVYDDKPPVDAVLNNDKLKKYVIEDKETGETEFLRPLRDYQQIFRNVALKMTEMNDRLAVLRKEKEYADRAKTKAEELIVALDARKAKLDQEKQLLERELAVVKAQSEKLDVLLAQTHQRLQAQLVENKQLADELKGLGKTAAVEGAEDTAARTP